MTAKRPQISVSGAFWQRIKVEAAVRHMAMAELVELGLAVGGTPGITASPRRMLIDVGPALYRRIKYLAKQDRVSRGVVLTKAIEWGMLQGASS